MRRALLVVAALALTGCGVFNWFQARSGCGLKCPANSTCRASGGGVFGFTAWYSCECDHGLTKGGSTFPTKDDPCPITPVQEKAR